eukprot:TRINITY_DN3310_c0_g1_i5.p2 TRINITY_DN3310_c0_g1~~TRINITY_DN3310_c0_g1_i5.p2  ORF type:complete len:136 (-),score=24.38 TRINITY_DN3310_c0_g1_i5:275-682(-)
MCYAYFSNDLSDFTHNFYKYPSSLFFNLTLVAFFGFCLNYTTFLCTTYNSPFAVALTHNFKDIFSTTLSIFLLDDLKANKFVVLGLMLSFLGAFTYSLTKVQENSREQKLKKGDGEDIEEHRPMLDPSKQEGQSS